MYRNRRIFTFNIGGCALLKDESTPIFNGHTRKFEIGYCTICNSDTRIIPCNVTRKR